MRDRDKLRAYKRAWNKRNRGRYAKQEQHWREKNRDRIQRARLTRMLPRLYGVTLDEYEQMFRAQGGQCGLCGRAQSEMKRRFSVDHDHTTGKIRALLCGNCNTGVGLLGDDPVLLRAAAAYVDAHREEKT